MKVTYRRSIREMARAGLNVVDDEVSLEAGEWNDWCDALAGLDPVWVAVRCDVEVAAARESARGDRAIGLVRGQSDVVHRFPDYDLEIDTTLTPVDEIVAQLDEYLARQSSGYVARWRPKKSQISFHPSRDASTL